MGKKAIKLIGTLILLFSLEGFSQSTEISKHPLLDKYYPQIKDTDTGTAATSQIKQIHETRPAPPLPTATLPAATSKTVPVATSTTVPAPITTSVPSETTTTVTAVPATTVPSVTTTAMVNNPVPSPAPAAKRKSKPSAPLYMDTRLGSSTKQYDTWEKNNNGAGSVTTSPK
jgi:hypothetical protein